MAKFCTKCGKPLEEGEVCSCQQAAPAQQASQQAAPAQQQTTQQQQTAGSVSNEQQFQQTQQAVAGFLSRTFGACLNVIKHPVTAGRDMILKGDIAASTAIIVIQAIVTTIFGIIAANKVSSLISMMMGGLGSLFGAYSDDIDLPYVKIIFGTLLISIALSFVLALLLFLGNMIIKNTLSFPQMMGAVAIKSCLATLTTVAAIIVFLLNPATGILVFITGTVWGFFVIILAMPLANEGMRNKLPLMMFLVFLIFAGITGFAMSKGSNLYVPSDEVEEEDFSDWFD